MSQAVETNTQVAPAVQVGSLVRVQDGELEEQWRIVPAVEADPSRCSISEDSPMARALLGHRPGDRVRVRRPEGNWPIVILAVERPREL
jgi:transcription elongation factor GreA